MTGYLVRRLWQSLLVLFGISIIIFTILHLTGDPAVLLMPPDATQEDIDNFRKLMGFNDPLFFRWPPWEYLSPPWRFLTDTQYGRFFTGVVRGDFGNSFRHQQPAMSLVMERMPATIQLTLTAMAIAVCVAVPVGILSAVRRNSALDHAGLVLALRGQSVKDQPHGDIRIDCGDCHNPERWTPVVKPPALRISHMASVISGTFMANWSVSHPDW
jgi:peptide/nickel transport system permease protein